MTVVDVIGAAEMMGADIKLADLSPANSSNFE
jgi:hypothetical protein